MCDKSVEAAGLGRGITKGTGDCRRLGVGGNKEITLGGSWDGTLGRSGNGIRMGRQASSTCRCQDLKMSRRLAIASTWEMFVGGATPARALATT